MQRRYLRNLLGAWLTVCVVAPLASAQTTRVEQINNDKTANVAAVAPETREKGDVVVTKFEKWFMPAPPASLHAVEFGRSGTLVQPVMISVIRTAIARKLIEKSPR